MNLVDSSAWLEYFAGGPQSGQFAKIIEDVVHLVVPTIVLLEVTRRVMQQRGEDEALQVAAVLHQGQVARGNCLDDGCRFRRVAWRQVYPEAKVDVLTAATVSASPSAPTATPSPSRNRRSQ